MALEVPPGHWEVVWRQEAGLGRRVWPAGQGDAWEAGGRGQGNDPCTEGQGGCWWPRQDSFREGGEVRLRRGLARMLGEGKRGMGLGPGTCRQRSED